MESLSLEDRKKLTLTGATKMISSTNTQAVVEVGDNNVVISGTNIEMTKLNLENKEVVFTGNIVSIRYALKTEKTPLFKRLFK